MKKRHYQKGKLQANIFDEHICKNPQQNLSKLNPTIHQNGHNLMIKWTLSSKTRMIQHSQINQCDTH